MTFSVLPEARAEGLDAAGWYEQQRSMLGREFLRELDRVLTLIENGDVWLPSLEEYSGPFDIRRSSLKRFPYQAIIHCHDDHRIVIAISHVQRKPLYWIDRL